MGKIQLPLRTKNVWLVAPKKAPNAGVLAAADTDSEAAEIWQREFMSGAALHVTQMPNKILT